MNFTYMCPLCNEENTFSFNEPFYSPCDVNVHTQCAMCGEDITITLCSDIVLDTQGEPSKAEWVQNVQGGAL